MPATFSSWLLGPDAVSDMLADPAGAGFTVFLLVSHIVLAAAVVRAYSWRLLRLATAALGSLCVSLLLYHPCRNGLYCLGVPMSTWRMADHVFVLNFLGNMGLCALQFALSSESARIFDLVAGYLVPQVAILSVLIAPFTAASGLVMIVFLIVTSVARLVWWLACETKQPTEQCPRCRKCGRYPLAWLVVALVAGAAGFVCYFFADDSPHEDSPENAIAHSFWHVLSGVAVLALVEAVADNLRRQLVSNQQSPRTKKRPNPARTKGLFLSGSESSSSLDF
jgi:hypothetical protein